MNLDALKIKKVAGRAVPVLGNEIDTDRVIPARFMKCVTFDELGQYLFYDVRFNPDGTKTNHPLNDAKFQGANILISNRNFGCGSSREHAPQSIIRYGFKAVVAESYAEIFADNCTTLGFPLVTAQKSDIDALVAFIEKNPSTEIAIDLESKTLSYDKISIAIHQPEQARKALIEGTWDSTAELLSSVEAIQSVASKIPYVKGF